MELICRLEPKVDIEWLLNLLNVAFVAKFRVLCFDCFVLYMCTPVHVCPGAPCALLNFNH